MTDARSPITTHVLDTARGAPAAGVPVSLSRAAGDASEPRWQLLATGTTDADGRIADLLAPGSLEPGVYRVRFDTATYFARVGVSRHFYPWAEIVVQIDDPRAHYHVPLLLAPFGYSTYRGS